MAFQRITLDKLKRMRGLGVGHVFKKIVVFNFSAIKQKNKIKVKIFNMNFHVAQFKNEKFNSTWEEVILPLADEIMKEDYVKVEQVNVPEYLEEFMKFRGAFQQRLKLFYFKRFVEDKKLGKEKMFPGDREHLEKDVYFMYLEFKDFLWKQRKRLGLDLGFLAIVADQELENFDVE